MADEEKDAGERLVPPDLSGRDPDEILRGFIEVDPEKVKERLERGNEGGKGDG